MDYAPRAGCTVWRSSVGDGRNVRLDTGGFSRALSLTRLFKLSGSLEPEAPW
jgi:hypothetical protein